MSARSDVLDHIERFNNPRRRHSKLGYLDPMAFTDQIMQTYPLFTKLTAGQARNLPSIRSTHCASLNCVHRLFGSSSLSRETTVKNDIRANRKYAHIRADRIRELLAWRRHCQTLGSPPNEERSHSHLKSGQKPCLEES